MRVKIPTLTIKRKVVCLILFFPLIQVVALSQSSIYSMQFRLLDRDSVISLSMFQGKKILLIPTASQDSSFDQYKELSLLHQLYMDSLVIITSPTNSFNTEVPDSSLLYSIYQQSDSITIYTTSELNVIGENIHPVYSWLASQSENSVIDAPVIQPFQKFLIGKSGNLIGVFSFRIRPMDVSIREAIESNF